MPNSLYTSAIGTSDLEQGTNAEDSFLDYATTGVASALVSGATGLYNSMAAIGNSLGASIDMVEEKDAIGSSLGYEAQQFYGRHKQGIDAAGFLGASIVPYLGATRAITALASAGRLGAGLETATGLKNADFILGSKSVQRAKDAVMAGETFSLKNSAVYSAYAQGAFGSALEVAAGEALVLALNNQNAMLNPDDLSAWDSFTKNGWETLTSPLFYGAAGFQTAFKSLEITGALRGGFSKASIQANMQVMREAGALTGLNAGDKATIRAQQLQESLDMDISSLDDFALRRKTKYEEGLRREMVSYAAELNTGNSEFVGEKLKSMFTEGTFDITEVAKTTSGLQAVTRPTEADAARSAGFASKSIVPSGVDISAELDVGPLKQKLSAMMEANGFTPELKAMAEDGTVEVLLSWRAGNFGYQINDGAAKDGTQFGVFKLFEDPDTKVQSLIPARFIYGRKLSQFDTEQYNAGRRALGQPEMSAKEIEDYVMLHELSHLKSNGAQAMGRIRKSFENGNSMAREITQLSYDARKDDWDYWLKLNRYSSIDEYINASYAAGRNKLIELDKEGKPRQYLTAPAELLADAGAMLSGPRAEEYARRAPSIAQLLKSYGGLKMPFQMSEAYLNTRTGKTMTGVFPNLADYRDFEVMGNQLRYKGDRATISYKADVFDFPESLLDSGELKYQVKGFEEQWAIASKYEWEEGKVPNLKGYDLPMIERAVELKHPRIDIDGVPMTSQQAREYLIESKKGLQLKFAQKLKYNEEELAKILNIDAETAGLGISTDESAWIQFGNGRDYTKPEHLKLKYAPQDIGNVADDARSFSIIKQRQALQEEINMRASATVIGPDFDKFPNMKDLRTLTDADQKQGSFFSLRPEFNTFRESVAHVGKIVGDLIMKKGQELEDRFAAVGKTLNHPNFAAARAELAVLDSIGNREPHMFVQVDDKAFFVPLGDMNVTRPQAMADLIRAGEVTGLEIKDKTVAQFMKLHQDLEVENFGKKSTVGQARGKFVTYNPYVWRSAPRDIRREKHVVFVVPSEVQKGKDSTHYMLFGTTKEELNNKIEALQKTYGNSYNIVTNNEVADWKKLSGSYEANGGFREIEFDASKLKEYKTAELAPNLDLISSATMERYRFYHQKQSEAIIRNGVELRYAAEIEALRRDAATYSKTDKNAPYKSVRTSERDNIWDDSIKTMLAIPPEMGVVGETYKQVSDMLGGKGSELLDAAKRMVVWNKEITEDTMNEINKRMDELGFQSPYSSVLEMTLASPETIKSRSLPTMIRFANTLVSTMMLPLDFANSIVQTVSLPIMLHPVIREAQKSVGQPVHDLLHVRIPGTDIDEPTPMKIMGNAFKAYWTDEGKELIKQLKDRNLLPDSAVEYREAMDFAGFNGSHGLGILTQKLDKLRNVAGKFTGYELSENLSKFTAAHSIWQIAQMRGIQGEELYTLMSSAIDKVNAVHRVNQRGTFFQGPVGQALGLFQSYSFNWMQNLMRNIAAGDKKSAAIQLALQSSVFGIRSLPGFRAMNQAIGETNRDNEDIYTTTNATERGSLGQYLLYGLGSHSLLVPMDLYNRGDTNPRNALLVPTSVNEIPAVSIISKTVSNAVRTGALAVKSLANGDPATAGRALIHGLAHNGLNRPLQGLGTVWAGEVTSQDARAYYTNSNYQSADGTILESDPLAYSRAEDINYAAIMTRFLGTKPLQESILLDDHFRRKAYQAESRKKAAAIGTEIKLAIEQGTDLSSEQLDRFANSYEQSGGDLENFNAFVGRQFMGANDSYMAKLQQELSADTNLKRMRDRMLIERGAQAPWDDGQQIMPVVEIPQQ